MWLTCRYVCRADATPKAGFSYINVLWRERKFPARDGDHGLDMTVERKNSYGYGYGKKYGYGKGYSAATAMVTVSRPVTRRNRKVNNNNELIIMEKNGTVTRTGVSVEESEQLSFDGMLSLKGDCALAFLALIVFSPLFLLCYIAVKREDGGPAIFKQERIGRFGRPFNIYKFRSMRLDAEKFGPALYKGGADPRMNRVGKFLRVHHLDELPQLWNVFVGDMSFIGPRPERKFYIRSNPRYRYNSGVTSYANNG